MIALKTKLTNIQLDGKNAFLGVRYSTYADYENIDKSIRPAYCVISRDSNFLEYQDNGDTTRRENINFKIFVGSQIINDNNEAEFKAIELTELVMSAINQNPLGIEDIKAVKIMGAESYLVGNEQRGKRLDTMDIIHVQYITYIENLNKGVI